MAIVLLIAAFSMSALATNYSPEINMAEMPVDTSVTNVEAALVVKQMVEAENTKDWNNYTSLWSDSWRDELTAFWGNMGGKSLNYGGLRGVSSAQLISITEVPAYQLQEVCRDYLDIASYQEVTAFIVGINYSVVSEDKYTYNGINFRMPIVAKFGDSWKVILEPEPALSYMQSMDASSTGLGNAIAIRKAREDALVMNASGYILADIGNVSDRTAREPEYHTNATFYSCTCKRPDSIKVYRTVTKKIETVAIKDYCVNVLPNEWKLAWNAASLATGIVAIENYAVFSAIYRAKYPSLGYDVKDDSNDQNYKPGTSTTVCTTAWTTAGGYHFETGSGSQWQVLYGPGSEDSSGKSSGKIYQNGSKCEGDQGKSWQEILHYYLDNSGNLGSSAAIKINAYK